jgi:hypothetical protein
MNFVPAASSFVHHAAYANVYERELRRTVRYQADCWSVITLAAQSASIIKGVPHEFCTC